MFRNMTIQKRFTTIIAIVLLATLPLVISGGFYLLKKNAAQEVLTQAEILVSVMEATRHYVVKYTTPILERVTPGKFIVEAMTDSYVNNIIFAQIEKDHPNYTYKEATIDPLNMKNKADLFEEKMINDFQNGLRKDEWRGFLDKPTGKFYSVMKPVRVVDQSCLSCHGDPDLAPEEVTQVYGKKHGYNWEVGDVVAVDAVYVPAEIPMKKAVTSLTIFTSAYITSVILITIIINITISRSMLKPINDLVATADKISVGEFQHQFHVKNNDELKRLANSFDRMKTSIVRLMKLIEKKNSGKNLNP